MRIQKIKLLSIWGVTIVSLWLFGCQDDRNTKISPDNSQNLAITSEITPKNPDLPVNKDNMVQEKCLSIAQYKTDNIFDPSQLKVGDRFLGLTVKRMEATCQNFNNSGEYVGSAAFKGKIVVSGVYYPQYSLEGDVGSPCFEIVRESEQKIPRMWGDPRTAWFCFDNPEKAQQLLGSNKVLLAKIAIDNYTINYEHSDVNNLATLTEVIDMIAIEP